MTDHLRTAEARLTVALEYLLNERDAAKAVALATFQLRHVQVHLEALRADSGPDGDPHRRRSDLMDNLVIDENLSAPELTFTRAAQAERGAR